jgi:hypothetical protein
MLARASLDGGTTYSAWSSATTTFTYQASGAVNWFQTTDEQFNTDTLSNTITTGPDSVRATTSSGSIMSVPINFSLVPGMVNWDTASWSTTEATGSAKLHIYYKVSANCDTIIPDSDLAGNSSGFASTSSPLDLSGLATTTYSSICLNETFTVASSMLTLNDWSVGWNPLSVSALNYRWRNDDGSESTATYAAATNIALTSNVFVGDRKRLRIQMANTGTGDINSYQYRLEYASNNDSCTTWTAMPAATTTGPWSMDWSNYVYDGQLTTDSTGIENPSDKTFTSGYIGTYSNPISSISLSASSFTEIEYSIRSTSNVTPGLAYCFRVTNNGASSTFVYTQQPGITVTAQTSYPRGGGNSIESSLTPNTPGTGGSAGGGTSTESTATSTKTSTSTPPANGGGGDVGFLKNGNAFVFASVAFAGGLVNNFFDFIKNLFSKIFRKK